MLVLPPVYKTVEDICVWAGESCEAHWWEVHMYFLYTTYQSTCRKESKVMERVNSACVIFGEEVGWAKWGDSPVYLILLSNYEASPNEAWV